MDLDDERYPNFEATNPYQNLEKQIQELENQIQWGEQQIRTNPSSASHLGINSTIANLRRQVQELKQAQNGLTFQNDDSENKAELFAYYRDYLNESYDQLNISESQRPKRL